MTKKPKDGVGPWAKEKLDALGEYLGFYTKVLKNQTHWCRGTIFVDAFAGPGRAKVRTKPKAAPEVSLFDTEPAADAEAVEYLKGSPRVALDIENPFSRYVFIERNPERVAELHALAEEYGDRAPEHPRQRHQLEAAPGGDLRRPVRDAHPVVDA